MTGMPDGAERSGVMGLAEPDAGDTAPAVTELFRDHHLELVRLAMLMVDDLATAEDVVQDAFERLHRGWDGLRKQSSSLAYVRASVLNGCRSVHRRAAVARKHGPRLAGRQEAGRPDSALASDDRSEMAAALRLLPRRQREVLVLRYYADLDIAEIAETLHITPSAVRASSSRGLVALARALREV